MVIVIVRVVVVARRRKDEGGGMAVFGRVVRGYWWFIVSLYIGDGETKEEGGDGGCWVMVAWSRESRGQEGGRRFN